MQTHLYLNLIPEALIFSQLSPSQFGRYLSIGAKKLTSGPAAFFEVDPEFTSETIKLDTARATCVAHPDGSPRRSSYAAIYNVLSQVPVKALKNLHLTTADGLTLEIERGTYAKNDAPGLHLYQEVCPVHPRVASPLAPQEFAAYVTNPDNPISLPRIVFCDLRLDGLAQDPERSNADNLPYRNINHLRECLTALKYKRDKMTKIVMRDMDTQRLFPVILNGFYVGDPTDFAYYPLPSEDEQATEHFRWFNSASKSTRL